LLLLSRLTPREQTPICLLLPGCPFLPLSRPPSQVVHGGRGGGPFVLTQPFSLSFSSPAMNGRPATSSSSLCSSSPPCPPSPPIWCFFSHSLGQVSLSLTSWVRLLANERSPVWHHRRRRPASPFPLSLPYSISLPLPLR